MSKSAATRALVYEVLRQWGPLCAATSLTFFIATLPFRALGVPEVALVAALLPWCGVFSVLTHEFGHVWAMPSNRIRGVEVRTLGVAIVSDLYPGLRGAFVSLAGPLGATLTGCVIMFAAPLPFRLLGLPFLVHCAALLPPCRDHQNLVEGIRSITARGADQG